MSALTARERERYARHLVLPEIGEAGQERLKASRVLVVGLGGLGSPIILYLAGAGVGTLGLVDPDVVTLSNLQRQVLHGSSALGRRKVDSAHDRVLDLNEDVSVETHPLAFDRRAGRELAASYDLIVDGTDNFEIRYAINDVWLELGIPYVYGAIFRLEGQASLLCADGGPCYRCLFPEAPPADSTLSGEQAGILGAVPGTVGTLLATIAIKWIVGIEPHPIGRLFLYDARAIRLDSVELSANPSCPSCGSSP